MTTCQSSHPHARWGAALVGLAAAALFLVLGSVNLGGQGVYYDELHQAAAAFEWLGREAPFFVKARVFDLPVFNMTYEGAIKSAMFGAWMSATGMPFSVEAWRFAALLSCAAGILTFAFAVAGRLPVRALVVFLSLIVTDTTILITTRHDWGPVAVAFLLRLTLLGVWVRSRSAPTVQSTFWIGLLLGLLVFEKRSAITLLLPVLVLLASDRSRHTWRHGLGFAIGGLIGGAPLFAKNALTLVTEGRLFSLGGVTGSAPHDAASLVSTLANSLTLGAGAEVREFVLGLTPGTALLWVEGLVLLAAVGLAVTCSGRRAALLCVAGFVLVGLGLWALPEKTWVHHRILATPFLYLAVALGLSSTVGAGQRRRAIALLAAVGLLVLARVPTIFEVTRAFAAGSSSARWSDDVRKLAQFAAKTPQSVHFVAVDWGMAVPIFCVAQGRPGVVSEPLVAGRLETDLSGYDTLYILTMNPPSDVRPDVTKTVTADLLARSEWQRVPTGSPLASLRDVRVIQLRRRR